MADNDGTTLNQTSGTTNPAVAQQSFDLTPVHRRAKETS